ncbi:DUF4349 domain-containing protein [Sediminibacterium ginsengisoli]|uniref:DUF4349 domain-containing protein n=1 Tax=Sediminibacterium ginsengisoli TaxID=413434 RepID=A0A1T4RA99_9BACT|nr:DUF4349 domain-containing protein [Sediminibacterium ginsengisoli]SKA12551.1 protein of unknown function [Sediminibacterium ginsengisoli]
MNRYLFCIAVLAILCYSCSRKQTTERELQNDQVNTPAAGNKQLSTTDTAAAREIMRQADLVAEMKDYKSGDQLLRRQITAFNAYVTAEEQHTSALRLENNLVIRVPAAKFDQLLSAISGEGITLLRRTISAEDVTAEAADTKARLTAKNAIRNQYYQLLKQAKSIKDILEIQKQIDALQEDIEVTTARSHYLSDQVQYSTIRLQYFQYLETTDTTDKITYFSRLKNAFIAGGSFFAEVLVLLTGAWPFLLLMIVGIWIWKKKKKPVTTAV